MPTWNDLPPQDPELVDDMSEAFLGSDGEIKAVLRVMFNSDSFKKARFKKVKSPIELVMGVVKMVGNFDEFRPGLAEYGQSTTVTMGQKLLDPPTVEGWHTGKEWIDGGNLTERVNFAVEEIGDGSAPGIQRIVGRLVDGDGLSTPESFVDGALDVIGPIEIEGPSRDALIKFATDSEGDDDRSRVIRMLRLVVATPEYQFA